MTPDIFFTRIVEPTLKDMAVSPAIAIPASDGARVLVMAIAGQESRWAARRQIGGPARSYWQFERGGGVAGLFRVAPRQLGAVCAACDVTFDAATVFEAMAWHDMLACAMARLLLWSDPAPLPAAGDKDAGWQYYLRTWRPGLPHPESWAGVYDRAFAAIGRAA
ncbi:hypothetical protein [Reyranella sp.]|uniref:hypothetical protein n=1 Tax=Reyranella sp. TaxID=1929291 RepID=UPI003D0F5897